MVDVVTHKCFPTLIHEFKLDINHDKMIDYVYGKGEAKGQIHQTQDDLHKVQAFEPLVDKLTPIHNYIIQKLEYEYKEIEITNMWSNHLYIGDSHPPHTHSNNFLSGVYYLFCGVDTSPIQFFDPRVQSSILVPRKKKNNWNNSSMLQFDSINGSGFIFPAWLQHWVPATHHERISVSWNVLVRGYYGEPKTFQNAHI
jgi:uncharacterized protein (TIGR02466 family)